MFGYFLEILFSGLSIHMNNFLNAKLSPNFSLRWAEMVFNLDLPHPPTRESIKMTKFS